MITLAVLGFATILLAVYVLSVATSIRMLDDRRSGFPEREYSPHRYDDDRRQQDRRQGSVVDFPLRINGEVIEFDRRKNPDRRRVS